MSPIPQGNPLISEMPRLQRHSQTLHFPHQRHPQYQESALTYHDYLNLMNLQTYILQTNFSGLLFIISTNLASDPATISAIATVAALADSIAMAAYRSLTLYFPSTRK